MLVVVSCTLLLVGVLLYYFPSPLSFISAYAVYIYRRFAGYRSFVPFNRPMPGNSSFSNARLLSTDERPSSPNGGSPFSVRRRNVSDLKILENDRMFGGSASPGSPSSRTSRFYGNRSAFDSDISVILPRNSTKNLENREDAYVSRTTSPAVSSLTSSRENWAPTSPSLGPGCYPWLIPNCGQSQKARVSLPSEPVKIKLHKRNIGFPVPPDQKGEDSKEDSTLKIIGALKALSRKRLHTTESDDDAHESMNNSKRRPIEFNSTVYSSHLISSNESSKVGLSDMLEKSVNTNGSQNSSDLVNSASSPQIPQKSFNNAVTLQHQQINNNKRPRATNDTGNQLSKRRNNEILSSLSSSIALLEQSVLKRNDKRRQETKGSSKKPKAQEMHCVEVQTLPSPIASVDDEHKKEDKGTATDKDSTDFTNDSSDIIVESSKPIAEKKVTEKMAAALLKSALKKLANSGDLLPSDTSTTSNSILSETSLTKNDVSVSISQTAVTSAPTPTGNLFSFGKPAVSAENVLCNGAVPSTSQVATTADTIPTLKFGSSSGFSLGLPAGGLGVIATTTPSIVPQVAIQVSAQQEGTKPASTISPLNTSTSLPSSVLPSSNAFTFGSNSISSSPTVVKPPAAITTPVSSETVIAKPATQSGFVFGASSGKSTAFTFGSSQPTTSSVSGQLEPKPVVTSLTPNTFQNSTIPGFPTNQTLGTTQQKLDNQSAHGSPEKSNTTATMPTTSQPAMTSPSKPGGFSFTPSSKFMFPMSTASATTTTVAAQPLKPVFSFGNSSSTKQDSGSKLFGMLPPPTSSANLAPELAKSFSPGGGFNFSGHAKDPPKLSGFPAPSPTLAVQKPEPKKQEGFTFGSSSPKPDASASPFVGSSAVKEPAKPSQSTFVFGSGNAASSFGMLSNTPNKTPAATVFGSTATTTSNLFGSSTGLGATSAGFGSQGQMSLSFKTTTTGSTFGSTSNLPPTTTIATQGFSSGPITNSTFTSSAPVFGSSTGAFGSSTTAFGSTTTFGSSTTPLSSTANTFGSNGATFGAATTPAPTASNPTPAFGAGPSTTPQFGTGAFGSSVGQPAPTFGSTFPAPTFGAAAQPQATPTTAPFNFAAPIASAAPASTSAFNFTAPQAGTSQQPQRPLFQFGAGSTSQPAGNAQPFAFSGAPAGPSAAGGYPMFSIGSGSSAPRSRAVLRTRKK